MGTVYIAVDKADKSNGCLTVFSFIFSFNTYLSKLCVECDTFITHIPYEWGKRRYGMAISPSNLKGIFGNKNIGLAIACHAGRQFVPFYDGLWYDPAERRTHDLLSERRTRYRLSQPDTVEIRTNPVHMTMVSIFTDTEYM